MGLPHLTRSLYSLCHQACPFIMSPTCSQLCTVHSHLIRCPIRSLSVTVAHETPLSWPPRPLSDIITYHAPSCSLCSSHVPTWQASCSLGALMNYTLLHNKLPQHLASWNNKAVLFLSSWGSALRSDCCQAFVCGYSVNWRFTWGRIYQYFKAHSWGCWQASGPRGFGD